MDAGLIQLQQVGVADYSVVTDTPVELPWEPKLGHLLLNPGSFGPSGILSLGF